MKSEGKIIYFYVAPKAVSDATRILEFFAEYFLNHSQIGVVCQVTEINRIRILFTFERIFFEQMEFNKEQPVDDIDMKDKTMKLIETESSLDNSWGRIAQRNAAEHVRGETIVSWNVSVLVISASDKDSSIDNKWSVSNRCRILIVEVKNYFIY